MLTFRRMRLLSAGLLLAACAGVAPAAKNLQIYSIDVEGGQATLLVTPSGDSMLIDAGWGGFQGRDAGRIAAAAKEAGVKKIDYLVITHYHADHVGGVQNLTHKLPIINFVDHGPSSENDRGAVIRFTEYSSFRDQGHHIVVKPGDTIPVKGIEVKVLTSDGELISSPLTGAGQPNPACAGATPPAATQEITSQPENPHSVGMLITYGSFRMLDLGDLTKDKDYQLACPVNKIGPVDLYLVSHHGIDLSGSAPFIQAIQPRVAVMNNGARKGGSPSTFDTLHAASKPFDVWQLHYAIGASKEQNSNDSFIANLEEKCEGKWLKITAEKDGSFQIYNSRNKFEKSYPAGK